jgi:hypothetical protein
MARTKADARHALGQLLGTAAHAMNNSGSDAGYQSLGDDDDGRTAGSSLNARRSASQPPVKPLSQTSQSSRRSPRKPRLPLPTTRESRSQARKKALPSVDEEQASRESLSPQETSLIEALAQLDPPAHVLRTIRLNKTILALCVALREKQFLPADILGLLVSRHIPLAETTFIKARAVNDTIISCVVNANASAEEANGDFWRPGFAPLVGMTFHDPDDEMDDLRIGKESQGKRGKRAEQLMEGHDQDQEREQELVQGEIEIEEREGIEIERPVLGILERGSNENGEQDAPEQSRENVDKQDLETEFGEPHGREDRQRELQPKQNQRDEDDQKLREEAEQKKRDAAERRQTAEVDKKAIDHGMDEALEEQKKEQQKRDQRLREEADKYATEEHGSEALGVERAEINQRATAEAEGRTQEEADETLREETEKVIEGHKENLDTALQREKRKLEEANSKEGTPGELQEAEAQERHGMESTLDPLDPYDGQDDEGAQMVTDENMLPPEFPEYDHQRTRDSNFESMTDYMYDVLEYFAAHSKTSMDTAMDQFIAHRLSNSRATNPYNMYLAMRREDPREQERLRALGIPTKGAFIMGLLYVISLTYVF